MWKFIGYSEAVFTEELIGYALTSEKKKVSKNSNLSFFIKKPEKEE